MYGFTSVSGALDFFLLNVMICFFAEGGSWIEGVTLEHNSKNSFLELGYRAAAIDI